MWAVAVELGEEGLSRFFSLTSPFLDERQRPLTAIDHFLTYVPQVRWPFSANIAAADS